MDRFATETIVAAATRKWLSICALLFLKSGLLTSRDLLNEIQLMNRLNDAISTPKKELSVEHKQLIAILIPCIEKDFQFYKEAFELRERLLRELGLDYII